MEDQITMICISTRLPPDLYERFTKLCTAYRRSRSSQILMLIEQFVAEQEAQKKAQKKAA